MLMKISIPKIVVSLFAVLLSLSVEAQNDSIEYEASAQMLLSKAGNTPFWIVSNNAGYYLTNSNMAIVGFGVTKKLSHPDKLFDYSFGLNGVALAEKNGVVASLREYYVNTRIWVFDLNLGQQIEHYGNQDETLSSGGYLFSANYAPIPKVFVGIKEFTPILFKNNFLEIKGGLSHGWFTDDVFVKNMLYHHKYAYARIGGNKSPVRFQYGFDHVAQWGGEIPGHGVQPTGIKDFINVFFLRSGNSTVAEEQINVGGNHIIAQSARLDATVAGFELAAYWQLLNEDKPVLPFWSAVNRYDGLWGLSVRNKQFPVIKGLLYEFLNTTDQNGPLHDKDGIVYGGADNYFNNYLYQSGWTHYGYTIGNPFITSPVFNKNAEISILNNRVQVHHFGLEGSIDGYNFKILNSYSKNYGTYGTPFSKTEKSAHLLVDVNKHFEKLWGLNIGLSVGADWSGYYGNNIGLLLKIKKQGLLLKY